MTTNSQLRLYVSSDDPMKFFSGCLSAMSTMLQLEVPHINVLSKVDLIKETVTEEEMERCVFVCPKKTG